MSNQINIIGINKKRTSNRLLSNDRIEVLGYITYNNNLLPVSGISLNLYTNYSGSWQLAATSTTDRFGYINLNHSCINISGITNCLGFISGVYQNNNYTSNLIRFDFSSKEV